MGRKPTTNPLLTPTSHPSDQQLTAQRNAFNTGIMSANPNGSIQEKAQDHMSQLDKELSKYPALNNFEQQTSVPKVYVILSLGALYFFLVFFNIAGEFLVNTAGFAIPAYYSLEALFTSGKADDTQWLPTGLSTPSSPS